MEIWDDYKGWKAPNLSDYIGFIFICSFVIVIDNTDIDIL